MYLFEVELGMSYSTKNKRASSGLFDKKRMKVNLAGVFVLLEKAWFKGNLAN